MDARAYKYRAYSSKTTARVLKTQLEVACKLYNALLHAEQEEYERNKHTMSNRVETTRLRPEEEEQRVPSSTFAGYPTSCWEVLPSTGALLRQPCEQAQGEEASPLPFLGVPSGWLEAF
ncbi:hypothetical protein B9Q03_10595 [Candidatus Marsarchaeota G2 archaeon OSP_D]|uniref:Transposase putative helix-turn-helix domain-containing protein n=4 Tax=Candidatus Marsarchaeota group 2 TaxID=2203771 RepID=A0A2R6AM31_9ARCH|nr:MAG: hypothetical protein B9Q03_10595 [Candidatus Marsarchaeota G2 archaeon OSP_D]